MKGTREQEMITDETIEYLNNHILMVETIIENCKKAGYEKSLKKYQTIKSDVELMLQFNSHLSALAKENAEKDERIVLLETNIKELVQEIMRIAEQNK